jgi:hypothetical protein
LRNYSVVASAVALFAFSGCGAARTAAPVPSVVAAPREIAPAAETTQPIVCPEPIIYVDGRRVSPEPKPIIYVDGRQVSPEPKPIIYVDGQRVC